MRTNPTSLPERIGIREVHRLAWPVMIGMLSHTAMTVADTLFVSRLGTAPLAGIGIGGTAAFLLTATGFGLTAGVRVKVATATGAGRHADVAALAFQAGWIALAGGLVGLVLAPASLPVVRLFGASPEAAGHASDYLRVMLLGTGPALGSLALQAWFQGRGDTRTPMVAAVLSNLLNIALDPVFIFGAGLPGGLSVPAWGAGGAALATVVGHGLSLAILAAAAAPALRGTAPWLRPRLLVPALRTGLPMALRGTLSVAGFSVFVAILAHSGDAHLGAHVIVLRIVSVSFLPGHAVGEAAGVLVGQALGANRPELVHQAFRAATRLAVAIMGTMALVFVMIPETLLLPFHPAPDVAVVAAQLMLIAAAFQVFDAVAMVAMGALNGAGDTRFTLLSGVGCMWLVNLPLGWFLALHLELGAVGAWLALTAEIVTYMTIAGLRVRGTRWIEAGMAAAEEDARAAEAEAVATVAAA